MIANSEKVGFVLTPWSCVPTPSVTTEMASRRARKFCGLSRRWGVCYCGAIHPHHVSVWSNGPLLSLTGVFCCSLHQIYVSLLQLSRQKCSNECKKLVSWWHWYTMTTKCPGDLRNLRNGVYGGFISLVVCICVSSSVELRSEPVVRMHIYIYI